MNHYSKHFLAFLFAILLIGSEQVVIAEIPWRQDPKSALDSAKEAGKPILVFVTAQWCHYCQKMKRDTWSDPQVQSVVSQRFETLRLDGDRDQHIVEKLGLRGYPATLVYTPDGRYVDQRGGYLSPAQTLHWLDSVRK